jgi:DNA-binding NtrC family response regulator
MALKKPGVIVVVGERRQAQDCLGVLSTLNYSGVLLPSLSELESRLELSPEVAVILDLDSVRPEVQFLRQLRKRYPRLHLMGISSRAYHPGLEEVIGSHLYACLVKPLDVEELGFWLKTIAENLAEDASSAESEG